MSLYHRKRRKKSKPVPAASEVDATWGLNVFAKWLCDADHGRGADKHLDAARRSATAAGWDWELRQAMQGSVKLVVDKQLGGAAYQPYRVMTKQSSDGQMRARLFDSGQQIGRHRQRQ